MRRRVHLRWAASAALAVCVLAIPARGDETRVRLAAAPDTELVRARCGVCHSLDYIAMNSPFLKRAGWEAEVRKMIKVMGAPIAESEVGPLVDYLTAHYGVE
jgi:hypothetical protein